MLENQGFPLKHCIPVAPLDYSSEGLILLTNSGEMASMLEKSTTFERVSK